MSNAVKAIEFLLVKYLFEFARPKEKRQWQALRFGEGRPGPESHFPVMTIFGVVIFGIPKAGGGK